MRDERILQSQPNSTRTSRLSTYLGQHFDFLDTGHSVFSRNSYYDDLRSVHPWSRRPCSRYSGIPFATLRSASCPPRVSDLARPRIKRERLIRQEFFDNITNYAYSGVKATALNAQCSERLAGLAQPKKTPAGYREGYTLPVPVPEGALRAHPTTRIAQLAEPRFNVASFFQSATKNGQK